MRAAPSTTTNLNGMTFAICSYSFSSPSLTFEDLTSNSAPRLVMHVEFLTGIQALLREKITIGDTLLQKISDSPRSWRPSLLNSGTAEFCCLAWQASQDVLAANSLLFHACMSSDRTRTRTPRLTCENPFRRGSRKHALGIRISRPDYKEMLPQALCEL